MKEVNPYKTGERILNRSQDLLYKYVYDRYNIGEIPILKRAKGPYLYDFDHNCYIDFYMAGGNLLLGHVVPQFTKVVKSWLSRGYSSGYPLLQSSQMLTNKIRKLIVNNKLIAEEDFNSFIIYFNSANDALLGAFHILNLLGLSRGAYYTSSIATNEYKIFNLENESNTDSKINYDYLFLKFTVPEIFNKAGTLINNARAKGSIIVSDERDFPAIYYQYINNKYHNYPDIRILGSWISSGYDFGMLIINKELLSTFSINNYDLLYYMNDFKFPPIFKIKGTIAFINAFIKRGGIKSIMEKQRYFIEKVKSPYFIMKSGLIFVNIDEVNDYKDFWFEMLKYGFFLPYNPELPVFVSLNHDEELILKSAKILNRL